MTLYCLTNIVMVLLFADDAVYFYRIPCIRTWEFCCLADDEREDPDISPARNMDKRARQFTRYTT